MDVIADLLRSSLLVALGDDAERVAHVRAAATALSDRLRVHRRDAVPAVVLAAMDEGVAADSSVLGDASEHLLTEWETFRIAFPEPPAEVLRAVALEAVVDATQADASLLQAAWYTARTVTEVLPAGRWERPLTAVVNRWRDEANKAIVARWVPTDVMTATLRMPALQPTEDTTIGIDTPLRRRAAEMSAQPTFQAFSQDLHQGFDKIIDQILDASGFQAALAQKRAVAQVKEFASTLGSRLRESIGVQEQTLAATSLRTMLLWWREARYSDRLEQRYSDLAVPAEVAIAAAHDLHLQVPTVAPPSAEHVLADLVAASAAGDSVTLSELAAAEEARLLPLSGSDATPAGILEAVTRGTGTRLLDIAAEVTPGRAAVLVFRGLQAARLAGAPWTGVEDEE